MSQIIEHPLEALLIEVGRAAPEPWYYQQFARTVGADVVAVGNVLELLYLEGLVQKAAPSPSSGPGVTLTEFGRQVLDDPTALARLRSGEPLSASQGAIVRQSLREPVTPYATRLLLAANFAVFAYVVYLTSKVGLAQPYIGAMPGRGLPAGIERALHTAGGLNAADVLNGEWWRLLTCCFVHLGALHIGMNMYALYSAGGFVEQTWGRGRYLVIYLVAGWGGSCMGMAYRPQNGLVGASGALCGVLAAEALWVLLNGRHLPAAMARRGRSQILTTVVLMVVISILPGVSGWGHLGGAVAGGAAALLLHYQRFGPQALRWLLVPAVAAVPWLSYLQLQDARAKNQVWQALEGPRARRDFVGRVAQPAIDKARELLELCEEKVDPLFQQGAPRRDPAKVAAVVTALGEAKADLATTLADITDAAAGEPFVEAKRLAVQLLEACVALCDTATGYFEMGKAAKAADEKALLAAFARVEVSRTALRKEMEARLKEKDKEK